MEITYDIVLNDQARNGLWRSISNVLNFNNRRCDCDYHIESDHKGYVCTEECADDCDLHFKCRCPYPKEAQLTVEQQRFIIAVLHQQGYNVTSFDLDTEESTARYIIDLFGLDDACVEQFRQERTAALRHALVSNWNVLTIMSGQRLPTYSS